MATNWRDLFKQPLPPPPPEGSGIESLIDLWSTIPSDLKPTQPWTSEFLPIEPTAPERRPPVHQRPWQGQINPDLLPGIPPSPLPTKDTRLGSLGVGADQGVARLAELEAKSPIAQEWYASEGAPPETLYPTEKEYPGPGPEQTMAQTPGQRLQDLLIQKSALEAQLQKLNSQIQKLQALTNPPRVFPPGD
jgi:hypothetical protein